MIKLHFLTILFFCDICIASTNLVSSIYKIDNPIHPEKNTLLLLTNGLVIKTTSDQLKKTFYDLRISENFIFEIDNDRNLLSLKPFVANDKTSVIISSNPNESYFKPTIPTSPNEVLRVFKELKKKSTSDSQCYNRSHVWAYESKQNFGISSMKIFLFFTRSYIREFNYKWWFHNAPMTYLYNDGSENEIVLDPEFSSVPIAVKKWTDIFIKNKDRCAEVSKYSQFDFNQETRYCYIIKENMFYYQPLDLEKLEQQGHERVNWIEWEIKNAYAQGFGHSQ